VILVVPFLGLAAFALLAPFSSTSIPASCTAAVPHLPPDRDATVPGVGVGTLLAAEADAAVIVVAGAGRAPSSSTAYIVNTRDRKVIGSLHIESDAVVAAISDGVVYLFDDKLGHILDASSGAPVQKLIESDNYRGLYTSAGVRYLQTDAEFIVLGASGSIFTHRHVDFAAIAYRCYFAPQR
jgi:hypothetical protein